MLKKKRGALRKRADEGPDGLFFGTPVDPADPNWRSAGRASEPAPKPFDFGWRWTSVATLVLAGLWAQSCAPPVSFTGLQSRSNQIHRSAQLLRSETPEFFKASQLTPETFSGTDQVRRSCFAELGSRLNRRFRRTLIKCIKIEPEPDSDLVKSRLASPDQEQAVNLLNTICGSRSRSPKSYRPSRRQGLYTII